MFSRKVAQACLLNWRQAPTANYISGFSGVSVISKSCQKILLPEIAISSATFLPIRYKTSKKDMMQKSTKNSKKEQNLESVVILVDKKKKYVCETCKKHFPSPSALQTHIDCVHLKIKKFKCPECEKPFGTQNNLNTHIKIVHEGRKDHICKDCGEAFGQKSGLDRHIKNVHEGQKDNLDSHIATNNENLNKPLQCETDTPVAIVHEKDKIFKCHYKDCDKFYKSKYGLTNHINSYHLKLKPHKCAHCGNTYAYKNNLINHIKSKHSKPKEEICNQCCFAFISTSELGSHIRCFHKDEKKYSCHFCKLSSCEKCLLAKSVSIFEWIP